MNVALKANKHGRDVVLAKVVHSSGEVVLAMPVRNRRFATPSLPPAAIEFARRHGATRWVIRFDNEHRCYSIPLDDVEHVAEPRDDGELYVDMRHFQRCRWHEWPFVTREVHIE
jgi:hypothetical protein